MALPKPVSRADMYLSYLNYTKGLTLANLPKPVSRADMYLYNLCINRGIGGGSGGSNVTLNGEPQTNFNFICSNVEQNGLISKNFTFDYNEGTLNTILIIKIPRNLPSSYILRFGTTLNGLVTSGTSADTVQIKYNGYTPFATIQTDKFYCISTVWKLAELKAKTTIYSNGDLVGAYSESVFASSPMANVQVNALNSLVLGLLAYNRSLTPKEIQHNITVINNSESINMLQVGDKKLLWAVDSQHVEMATGRTWEEEYTSLLKQHGKEFTSTGTPITVNNAIKGKVISGSLGGNTKVYKRLKGTQDVWVEIPSTETRDTVTYEYKLDSTQCILSNNGSLYPIYEPTIKGTATGLAPTIVFSPVLPTLVTGDVLDLATKTITFANATTKVLTDEQMKAYSTYKKVISLGGVGDVQDTLEIKDDGSVVYTQNTKEIVLDNNINCTLTNSYSSENHLFFNITVQDIKMISDHRLQGIMCDKFKWEEFASFALKDYEFICGNKESAKVGIKIAKTKLESPTVEGFKKWLQANPVTVRYQLASPIVTHIPKELVPTILTNQTNILDVGGAVKPSSFKVTVPVDRLAEIEARLQALENTTVDVVLNK